MPTESGNESPSKENGTQESKRHVASSRPLDLHSSFVRNTFTLSDGQPREFLWTCELTKESPEFTWDFDEEDDDLDYLSHTLFLRHAVMGKGVTCGERHLIEVETKNYIEKDIKTPLVCMTAGENDMASIDLNFSHEIPVTFRLVEGSGPVHLNGQHLAEIPPPNNVDDDEELEAGCTEGETATDGETGESEEQEEEDEEEEDEEDEEEEEELPPKKAKKRKGSRQLASKKPKRGKMDAAVSSDEDDEEDEDEESMDEDEEELSTPEKKKKSSAKAVKRPTAKALKAKKKADPPPKAKGGRKSKAK